MKKKCRAKAGSYLFSPATRRSNYAGTKPKIQRCVVPAYATIGELNSNLSSQLLTISSSRLASDAGSPAAALAAGGGR
jgi:hypothetical protein